MLTGLPNRTLLLEQANEIISYVEYKNEPLTLMFLDLDHFKNINETLGHRVGDKLFTEIGKHLESCLDVQDQVYRLGGDEFILIIKNSNADMAVQIANKLLFLINVKQFNLRKFNLSRSIEWWVDSFEPKQCKL